MGQDQGGGWGLGWAGRERVSPEGPRTDAASLGSRGVGRREAQLDGAGVA